jgi:uncharacterized protein (DUF924 family)
MPLAGDLGGEALDVHVKAREVLGFWFDLAMPEQWFAGAGSFDDEVTALFGPLRDAVLDGGAAGWRDDPETLLAAVIVLDQFSRNIHRDTAEAFAADPLALELALEAVRQGWDASYPPVRRAFCYLPFEHAEDAAMQALSVEKFAVLGIAENLKYAREHAEVIARFGRFPSRNAALGRESTREEAAFLAERGAGW